MERYKPIIDKFQTLFDNSLFFIVSKLNQPKDIVLEVMPLIIGKAVTILLQEFMSNNLDEVYKLYGNKQECSLFAYQFTIHTFNGSIELSLSTIDKMVDRYMCQDKQKDFLMVLYEAHNITYQKLGMSPYNARQGLVAHKVSSSNEILMFEENDLFNSVINRSIIPSKENSFNMNKESLRASFDERKKQELMLQIPQDELFKKRKNAKEVKFSPEQQSERNSNIKNIDIIDENNRQNSKRPSLESRQNQKNSSEDSRESTRIKRDSKLKRGKIQKQRSGVQELSRRISDANSFQHNLSDRKRNQSVKHSTKTQGDLNSLKQTAQVQLNFNINLKKDISIQSERRSYQGDNSLQSSIMLKNTKKDFNKGKLLRIPTKNQVQDKLKGIFQENDGMMGKFLEIDAELEFNNQKKPGFYTDRSIVNENLTGTLKTSKSGSNRGENSSQQGQTQRSQINEIQSASQQLKAEQNKQNFFLKTQQKNQNSLEVEDEYKKRKSSSHSRFAKSSQQKNNFNRYGISSYLKNIYQQNDKSLPMVSRSDSVQNAPIRLSKENSRSQQRNTDFSSSYQNLHQQSDDTRDFMLDQQEKNLGKPKFFLKWLKLQEEKKQYLQEEKTRKRISGSLNRNNTSIESAGQFTYRNGQKVPKKLGKHTLIYNEIEKNKRLNPQKPYQIDQMESLINHFEIPKRQRNSSKPSQDFQSTDSDNRQKICQKKSSSVIHLPRSNSQNAQIFSLSKPILKKKQQFSLSKPNRNSMYDLKASQSFDKASQIQEQTEQNSKNVSIQKTPRGLMKHQENNGPKIYNNESINYYRDLAGIKNNAITDASDQKKEKKVIPILKSLYKDQGPVHKSYKDVKIFKQLNKPQKNHKTSRFLRKQQDQSMQDGPYQNQGLENEQSKDDLQNKGGALTANLRSHQNKSFTDAEVVYQNIVDQQADKKSEFSFFLDAKTSQPQKQQHKAFTFQNSPKSRPTTFGQKSMNSLSLNKNNKDVTKALILTSDNFEDDDEDVEYI